MVEWRQEYSGLALQEVEWLLPHLRVLQDP